MDEFHDALAGLVLAEIELGEGEQPPAPGPEVTRDPRFTGGYLAHATLAQIDELLRVARAVRIGQPAQRRLPG
ncbi:hypothetical protein [Allorhizocola rhizosphaerae]|uniref:hypothetical protein n=1 Tax=Allorhizocola rhizosphaerae TaxID=1872709 RepID=UPI000E3C18FA|nr:hypothetical protein [Allorhizocola rhizosphaerae]